MLNLKDKTKILEEDYRNWGKEGFIPNIYDIIVMASSRVRYEFELGRLRGKDVHARSFEVLDYLKKVVKDLNSENIEEQETAKEEIQEYVKITRHIVLGKTVQEEEIITITAQDEAFNMKDSLEQIQKELNNSEKLEEAIENDLTDDIVLSED